MQTKNLSMRKLFCLVTILFLGSFFSELFAQKVGGVKTYWIIGKKSRNCDGLGICKFKKAVIVIKASEDDGGDEDSEERVNPNLPYQNFPCETLAPDEAILLLQRLSENTIKLVFLTPLNKSSEELTDNSFYVDEDIPLPNFLLGIYDSKTFTIASGQYQIQTDNFGKWFVIVTTK